MTEHAILLDNNVIRKILSKEPDDVAFRNRLFGWFHKYWIENVSLVRTSSSLFEIAGLKLGKGNIPKLPENLQYDNNLVNPSDSQQMSSHILQKQAELRNQFSSISWNQLVASKNQRIKHWDMSSDIVKKFECLYFSKFAKLTDSYLSTMLCDVLVSAALQHGLTHSTDQKYSLSIYQSCLDENYGSSASPIIVTPYRAVSWYAVQGKSGEEREAIEGCMLKGRGDMLDGEGISLSQLGFPILTSNKEIKIIPVYFVTADPLEKIQKRAKLFHEYHSQMLNRCPSVKNLQFIEGKVIVVDEHGSLCKDLSSSDWSSR